jgi:small subunit ribosomal protein S6
MKHYEIVVIIHPDQSEQVSQMVEKYKSQITSQGGKIHRFEDWGRRQFAYPINKIHKGHYILMNIECSLATLNELNSSFKFNDAVIRTLVLCTKGPVTGESPILKNPDDKDYRSSRDSDDSHSYRSTRNDDYRDQESDLLVDEEADLVD